MLSRLLFVRLKAAENALRDGRIDEAYRLAMAADIREHRRGAAVLSALTEQFIERARLHYRGDRFAEAAMDLDRAEAGGVKKDEIAELRDNIRTVAAEEQRREQSRRDRNVAARRRIEDGSLVGGQRILEQASKNDLDAERLKKAIADRADDAKSIVEQAEQLMAQGLMAAAAKRLQKARKLNAHDKHVTRAEKQLCDSVLDTVRSAIVEGKLSRAADELDCLGQLGDALPVKRELREMLSMAGEAAHSIRQGTYSAALRKAMSLARLVPKAQWITDVIEQLGRIDTVMTSLAAGPLGGAEFMREEPGREKRRVGPEHPWKDIIPEAAPKKTKHLDDTVALPAIPRRDGGLPDRLLLLVDGGGSYLLLRSPQASVGRAASKHPADIAIYSDVAERHANVTRVDDDYFVFASKELEVAGRKTKHQLLRDGDRIVLGRKAKMTFRLPSRKSPTAVLDLSDTTKMPNDVRRVVMFHQQAMVGAGPGAHIRCRHAGAPMVLFERNGSLWVRLRNDGHVDAEAAELPLGETVEIGGVRLVLKPWHVILPGGRTV